MDIPAARTAIKTFSAHDTALREVVGWLSNPEVVKFSEQRHRRHTIDTQRAYIKSFGPSDHYFGVYLSQGGSLIGTVSVHSDTDNGVANIGILIGDKMYWKQGYGLEVWAAVCNKMLTIFRKIEAGCMSCNFGMMSICSNYGMMEEGRQEDHFLYHDVPMDLVHWGKIK